MADVEFIPSHCILPQLPPRSPDSRVEDDAALPEEDDSWLDEDAPEPDETQPEPKRPFWNR